MSGTIAHTIMEIPLPSSRDSAKSPKLQPVSEGPSVQSKRKETSSETRTPSPACNVPSIPFTPSPLLLTCGPIPLSAQSNELVPSFRNLTSIQPVVISHPPAPPAISLRNTRSVSIEVELNGNPGLSQFVKQPVYSRATSCPVSFNSMSSTETLPLKACVSLPTVPPEVDSWPHGLVITIGGENVSKSNPRTCQADTYAAGSSVIPSSYVVSTMASLPPSVPDGEMDIDIGCPGIVGFGIGMTTSVFALFLCFIEYEGPRTTSFRRGLTIGICSSALFVIAFCLAVFIFHIFY